jgi:uncharacterized protein
MLHEIRDPVHIFVYLDSDERMVLDSIPFQRLRNIHQLALTFLLYPGASHKRFEHSLGVMEFAGRVFDIVTNPQNLHSDISELISQETRNDDRKRYWRKVLRLAALCHDLGHLPFSHAAEKDLLPEGWSHERLTVSIIRSDEMKRIWEERMTPPVRTEDIVKLAVGEKDLLKFQKDITFSPWESALSHIIVGDALGVDRMDYLLRDSHHTGVFYGKFDHYRLIDSLRILPQKMSLPGAPHAEGPTGHVDPVLGIEDGGLHSAEALALARYFMFSQLYLHHVRRIFDMHLKEFLKKWLPEGKFPIDVENLLKITDNEVNAEISKAYYDNRHPCHKEAERLYRRNHYKLLYARNAEDFEENEMATELIYRAACEKFGEEHVRKDTYTKDSEVPDFPVSKKDGRIIWSRQESKVFRNIPPAIADYVFIDPEKRIEAFDWLTQNRSTLIRG